MSGPNRNLREALLALGDETREAQASPRVRLALQAELRSRRRRRALATWWPALAAAAACLVIGIAIGRSWTRSTASAPQLAQVAPAVEVPTPAALETPEPAAPGQDRVLPLAQKASRRLNSAPAVPAAPDAPKADRPLTPWFFYTGLPLDGPGRIVRVQVSATTAAQFGVYSATERLPAQLFIGDDGLPRAIRFVR